MRRTYANSVEYSVPDSLDALAGPSSGVIELPRTLYWGPEQDVDLSDHSDTQRMYQAVVRIGTVDEQKEWLDRNTLIRIWPDLVLPIRCIAAWESRFPELSGQ